MKLRLLIIASAMTASFASAQEVPTSMRAFPGVAFDTWTHGFTPRAEATGTVLTVEGLPHELARVFSEARTVEAAFKGLVELQSRMIFTSDRDHLRTAEALMRFHEELRLRTTSSVAGPAQLDLRKQLLIMLQYAAEETQYVGKTRFPQMSNEFKIIFDADPVMRAEQSKPATIRDIPVRSGDFAMVKFSGHGVSDIIATSTNVPGAFSHTFPMSVENDGRILAPEAGITTGVRESDVGRSYNQQSMTRTWIMRAYSNNPEQREALVEKAAVGVRTVLSELKAAGGHFEYDLVFDILDKSGKPAYSCAETTWLALNRGGLLPKITERNAYSNYFSRYSDGSQHFFSKMMNAQSPRFLAPSDFQVSAGFQTVGLRIDVKQLEIERVGNAVMDSLMKNIETNASGLNELVKMLEFRADDPMSREQIEALRLAGFPKELVDGLSKSVGGKMSLKQALFFSFIQEVYSPKLRDGLMQIVAAQKAQGRVMGMIELRQHAETHGRPVIDQFSKMVGGLAQIAQRPEFAALFENRTTNLRRAECSAAWL